MIVEHKNKNTNLQENIILQHIINIFAIITL